MLSVCAVTIIANRESARILRGGGGGWDVDRGTCKLKKIKRNAMPVGL
jgi:hypothetical protein